MPALKAKVVIVLYVTPYPLIKPKWWSFVCYCSAISVYKAKVVVVLYVTVAPCLLLKPKWGSFYTSL